MDSVSVLNSLCPNRENHTANEPHVRKQVQPTSPTILHLTWNVYTIICLNFKGGGALEEMKCLSEENISRES